MKKLLSLLLCICFLISFAGCSKEPKTDSFYALNTVIEITLSPDADEEIFARLRTRTAELETLLSRTDEDGALYALNHGGTEMPSVLWQLLTLSLSIAEQTDGAFDPTLGALTELWRITDPDAPIPSDAEIAAARERCGYRRVTLTGGGYLAGGVTLDLGAIAKGYIAECLVGELVAAEVPYGVLWLGGNVDAWLYGM